MTIPTRDIPERGDIFWADLPSYDSVGSEQRGARPVLILSVNIINASLPICVIVPLSAQLAKANTNHRIRVLESERIQKPGTQGRGGESLALTEQVRCIARKRLDPKRVARLKSVALASVEAGVKYVLGLP